ncbi:MAG: fused MFS/spermidine synthase, partial [Betaproteobacteria bacterium]|nr:fused MFS/spermidine synthase [Betaproteobacteria bacterium]
ALFMGGMAIGSWLCSRYSGRWKNLLVGYAIAEALIGLAALVFHPVFVAATDAAYSNLLPALGDESLAALAKWTLAGALILPQSVLLGTTFPLMSAGLIRRYPGAPGESLSMLYFTNSFGAAIGVLASGFVMIDRLGLPGTMQSAGAINLGLAAVVWLLARGNEPAGDSGNWGQSNISKGDKTRGSETGKVTLTPISDAPWGLFLAIALFTGAASFIYEIGWIRMLSLVLGSSTHSFELMLSAFILGLAGGGLWVRRRIDSIRDPMRFLGIVQVLMGLLALATLVFYGQMFGLMQAVMKGLAKTDSGYAMFLGSSHAIALVIMFPATFCAGMTLPLITYALLRGGHGERAIGAVYSANTLGSIIGVFAAAHIGLPLLGLKGLIAAGAALDCALGLVLLWRSRDALKVSLGWGAATAASFVAVLTLVQLDSYKMASGVFRRGDLYSDSDATILFHKDGKTTTVTLMDFQEGRSLRTNGKSDGAINMNPGARISDEITMVMTGALPLAYKPEAKDAAVIGIGTGLSTHTLVANPGLETIDTIEIEPAMAQASRLFAPINSNAYADPRSRIIFDDAKTYFSTRNRLYDIIVSEPSNPWVSGVSSLFTGEFYQLVRRYLKPGGVLVQWFQLYEIDISLVASVLRALGENFPDYVIYAATNSDLLIVAGDREALARPLADITAMPGVSRELARVHVRTLGDVEMRRIGGKQALGPFFSSYGVPANSDYYPFLDLNAAKFRFMQQSAGDLTNLGSAAVPVVAMLEGRDGSTRTPPSLDGEEHFDKIENMRRAQYSRDFFVSPNTKQPVNIPRQLQKDLEIARLGLIDCRDPDRFDIWFHSLYQIARSANALLSAEDARAMWARLESPPCATKITAAQRQWIEMYCAVAHRDAAKMAELAEALLRQGSDLPGGHRQYLITAGMTGHLARGETHKAADLWSRYPKDVDGTTDLDLRLLYAHAFQK